FIAENTGDAEMLSPHMPVPPDARGIARFLEGNARMVRGNTGMVGGNTGILRGNTGILRGNTGILRGNTGILRGNTGILRGNTGMVRGNARMLPGATAAVLIVNASQDFLLMASWSQVNRSLIMTLRYPTSLRMQAVMATLNGFPAAVSRS